MFLEFILLRRYESLKSEQEPNLTSQNLVLVRSFLMPQYHPTGGIANRLREPFENSNCESPNVCFWDRISKSEYKARESILGRIEIRNSRAHFILRTKGYFWTNFCILNKECYPTIQMNWIIRTKTRSSKLSYYFKFKRLVLTKGETRDFEYPF